MGRRTFVWGLQSDALVPADYNGDGKSEPGIFRRSNQRWYVPPCAVTDAVTTKFGTTGDVPAILPQN